MTNQRDRTLAEHAPTAEALTNEIAINWNAALLDALAGFVTLGGAASP